MTRMNVGLARAGHISWWAKIRAVGLALLVRLTSIDVVESC